MSISYNYTLLRMIAGVLISASSLSATDIVSFSDPAPMFSVYGQGRPSLPGKKSQLALSVVPYYQYARNAKDATNKKVALGDRLGLLNMLGLLIHPGTDSWEYTDIVANAPLSDAYTALATAAIGHDADLVFVGSTYQPLDASDARVYWGKYDTAMSFSRIGARGSLDYCFFNGVGVAVRGGVAEYAVKQPVYTGNPLIDPTTGVVTVDTSSDAFLTDIKQFLTGPGPRHDIGAALGINFDGVKNTGVEDMSIELSWRRGFSLKDNEGDHVVTATPLAAFSMTLPTAEKKIVGNLWDISLGSDGFYGLTGLAEVSFDFPGMLNVGFGGSGTYFNEDTIGKQFAPTSDFQVGIYPWQVAVTKRPGALWKAYATVKAARFVDSLSCYVTYMYVAHEKDTLTFTGANNASFKASKLEKDGAYNAQLIHLGFEYEVTSSLRFGAALQSIFAGMQVWKTTTFAGSLSFVF
ncbi:MAG: hypothetical protein QG604_887 [Candidatus Dependentiae bacterium]|nr:hypothetical protein [Candidatus Dependentiae bacterium]